MHILLTNDDGYTAHGIQTLNRELKNLGYTVTMIAPRSERSAQSHSMTFYQAVQVNRVSDDVYAVNGTPADCVAIALSCILKDNPPDVIVSGINHGLNVGIDVNYSGTVGAATEGALMGFRAIALSLDTPLLPIAEEKEQHFIKIVSNLHIILKNIDSIEWPKHQVLNINFPADFKSIKSAVCDGNALYVPVVEEFASGNFDDTKIYLIGGKNRHIATENSQDVSLVSNGYAAMSFINSKQASIHSRPTTESILSSFFYDKE